MENTILKLMVNHHVLIESLFLLFRNETKEKSPRASISFSEFSWELRKHFFAEEGAIFESPAIKDLDVSDTINHLKEEHVVMLSELQKFAETFSKIKEEEIEKFANLLENHRHTEEKILYPKLDKELSSEQKNQIVLRINQIPLNFELNK